MKKSMKAALCILSAMVMLGGNALTASAGTLTAEELFEKYATEFPVYKCEDVENYGIRPCSLDRGFEWTAFDAEGNEIGVLPENAVETGCKLAINPYRFIDYKTGKHKYSCNYENGFYYAVLENGTAIIAGAENDWINENSPEKLVIPAEIGGLKVTEIADYAFSSVTQLAQECEALREIVIPDTVEVIHSYAFEAAFRYRIPGTDLTGRRKGAKINIPENVKIIYRRAFADLVDAIGEEYTGEENAKRVITLPESLEYVQTDAFQSGNSYRYIFKMPQSLVLTDTTVIGGSETIEFSHEPQYALYNYWTHYYIDGEFNVVTFTDAIKYQKEKQGEDYQIAAEVLLEERADESGDVDVSGNVDVCDAVLLSRFCAEDAEAVITEQGRKNADVNEDGNITPDDTRMILRKIANLS